MKVVNFRICTSLHCLQCAGKGQDNETIASWQDTGENTFFISSGDYNPCIFQCPSAITLGSTITNIYSRVQRLHSSSDLRTNNKPRSLKWISSCISRRAHEMQSCTLSSMTQVLYCSPLRGGLRFNFHHFCEVVYSAMFSVGEISNARDVTN